jgi:hypothetical protein
MLSSKTAVVIRTRVRDIPKGFPFDGLGATRPQDKITPLAPHKPPIEKGGDGSRAEDDTERRAREVGSGRQALRAGP